MLIIAIWGLVALSLVALGNSMKSDVITGIGAVMVLMMSMIAQVN